MSQQLGTILVAVDFGAASARALALAGALAAATGARLRVLHAESIDAPPYFTPAQLDVLEGELQENRARATAFLRDFVRQHTAVPFEPVIESRTPTEAVLHASSGVDLVMMGTHGRRGPSHWWLGSVAERVLRETRVPLMVVHENVQVVALTAFTRAMLLEDGSAATPRTTALTEIIARTSGGTVIRVQADEVPRARADLGATWVAVPVPTPRDSRWLSQVGEPLVQSCTMPVLFVPEIEEGSTS
jgi:nucleotide-binding universal stress UspA family protein